jgi:NAD(P)-dependent dehydrogenase (short-subunit alcohol dehydrogenase family)
MLAVRNIRFFNNIVTAAKNGTDEATLSSSASHIAELFPPSSHHLHLGLCLPGVLHVEKHPKDLDFDKLMESFKVNVAGPMMMMKHYHKFLPRKTGADASSGGGEGLPREAVWAFMAARVGSVSDNRKGGWYSYRASKSAVFQAVKTFDLFLRE